MGGRDWLSRGSPHGKWILLISFARSLASVPMPVVFEGAGVSLLAKATLDLRFLTSVTRAFETFISVLFVLKMSSLPFCENSKAKELAARRTAMNENNLFFIRFPYIYDVYEIIKTVFALKWGVIVC